MTSPGQIEMERLRERADRLQGFYDTHADLEGPVLDAVLMADLAMQWWDKVSKERDEWSRTIGGPFTLDEREQRIASFAFGELWDRLRRIEARMAQPPLTGPACPA